MNDGDALSLLDELGVSLAPPSADLLARLEARGFAARRDAERGFSAAIGDGPVNIALIVPAPRQEDLATFIAAAARVALRCRKMARFTIAAADPERMPERPAAFERPDLAIVACDAGIDRVVVGGPGRLIANLRWTAPDAPEALARLAAVAEEFVESLAEEAESLNVGRGLKRDRLRGSGGEPRVRPPDGLAWIDVDVRLALPSSLSPFVVETWLREIGPEAELTLTDVAPAWGARGCGGLERAIAEVIRREGRAPRFVRRPLPRLAAEALLRLDCPVVGYGPSFGAAETLRAIKTLAAGIDLHLTRRQNPPA